MFTHDLNPTIFHTPPTEYTLKSVHRRCVQSDNQHQFEHLTAEVQRLHELILFVDRKHSPQVLTDRTSSVHSGVVSPAPSAPLYAPLRDVCRETRDEPPPEKAGAALMLRILKCSDPHYWYAKKVGQLVSFISKTEERYPNQATTELAYWSKEEGGHINLVRGCDAELVEVSQVKEIK